MKRLTGKKGDILKLVVPIEMSGLFGTQITRVGIDILIESVSENGQITVIVGEPSFL